MHCVVSQSWVRDVHTYINMSLIALESRNKKDHHPMAVCQDLRWLHGEYCYTELSSPSMRKVARCTIIPLILQRWTVSFCVYEFPLWMGVVHCALKVLQCLWLSYSLFYVYQTFCLWCSTSYCHQCYDQEEHKGTHILACHIVVFVIG